MKRLTHAQPEGLYDFFRSRRRTHLKNPEALAAMIAPQCRNVKRGWDGGQLRLLQDPQEFALWLILMRRHGCRSYVEIGVNSAASLYLVDSYLRATVPGFSHSLGIDIADARLGWEGYAQRWPETEFILGDSSKVDLGDRQFDAGFIDGSHVERAVLRDYNQLNGRVRLLGFHDIAGKRIAVNRAWVTVLGRHPKRRRWQFITTTPKLRWMKGIGAILLK